MKVLGQQKELRLEHAADGRMLVVSDEARVSVRVTRCFPWSEPGQFVSLRNETGEEVMLIEQLNDLPEASRRVLEEALAEAGFLMEVIAVESIEEEVEIRNWKVTTAQGPRTFQTKLDEWPRRTPGGGVLIRDVAGDLYIVNDVAQLDVASGRVLAGYVD